MRSTAVFLAALSTLLLLAAPTRAAKITEYPIPTASAGASSIVAGPDGRLWFTEYTANRIGAVTTAGVVTEYDTAAVAHPVGIAVGFNRKLVFNVSGGYLGEMTVDGQYTETPGAGGGAAIAAGPDGRVWSGNAGTVKAFHYWINSPATATFQLGRPRAWRR